MIQDWQAGLRLITHNTKASNVCPTIQLMKQYVYYYGNFCYFIKIISRLGVNCVFINQLDEVELPSGSQRKSAGESYIEDIRLWENGKTRLSRTGRHGPAQWKSKLLRCNLILTKLRIVDNANYFYIAKNQEKQRNRGKCLRE